MKTKICHMRLVIMQILLIICFVLTSLSTVISQTTDISGVINDYYHVVSIDVIGSSATLNSTSGISVQDELLLIQMQGAVIQTANDTTYGDVTDLNGAGQNEIVQICSIVGNTVFFSNTLINSDYDASGNVQLVSIPQYQNANVTSELNGQAWDGQTGGVLIFEVSGLLTLNANINMSGKGFRGATDNSIYSCAFSDMSNDYFYPDNGIGSLKGEGIAITVVGMAHGRGAQANGGGGGNNHNSGGGGGGNQSNGGLGGKNGQLGLFQCKGDFPGIGGKAPSTTNEIFLGGAGGSGHGNNFTSSAGGNGGGIVIIRTNEILVNNGEIQANGQDADHSSQDAAGGGGAGGTIYLEANVYSSNVDVSAYGGAGGNYAPDAATNLCNGPGGGGSGGLISSESALPIEVIVDVSGGQNGLATNLAGGTTSCLGSSQGAMPGQNGVISIQPINASSNSIVVQIKALLQGPLDFGSPLMNDQLRSKGVIPLTEPYTGLGYSHVGGGGGETISGSVLSTTGPNAIVDWIFVQLRDQTNSSTIIATRSALIQRDGDIVDVDGTSPLSFSCVAPGNYHIVIQHRIHLSAMTLNPIALSGTPVTVNFVDGSTPTYGSNAQINSFLTGGQNALWAGDTNGDKVLTLTGQQNDPFWIFLRVLTDPANTTFSQTFVTSNGYYAEDLNMDGNIVLTGTTNDPFILNVNVITHPLNTSFSQTFQAFDQLP